MALIYYQQLANFNNFEKFYCECNYIGYILPNGRLLPCKRGHNISNVETFLKLYLDILASDFSAKEVLLNMEEEKDYVKKIIIKFLHSLDESHFRKFYTFYQGHKLLLSDLLVQLFNFDLVARIDKTIVTTKNDSEYFYNYLLMGFNIVLVPKIIYNEQKESYEFIKVTRMELNRELLEDVKMIRKTINPSSIPYFFK